MADLSGFSEEELETVEMLRDIMVAAADVVCCVISYAKVDSQKNGALTGEAMSTLGDEVLAFMHESGGGKL